MVIPSKMYVWRGRRASQLQMQEMSPSQSQGRDKGEPERNTPGAWLEDVSPQSSISISSGGDIDTVPSDSMGFLSTFGLIRPFPVSALHQSWLEETKAVP